MSHTVKDPLAFLAAFDPANSSSLTSTIHLVLRDMDNMADKVDTDIVFSRDTMEAKEAVVDWLRQSPLYVWPYADIEYTADFKHATLYVRVDATVFKALDIRDEGMSVKFDLARKSASTLARLFNHVNRNRKISIG